MPVLVTAAHQPLARRIATRLLAEGGEVRAFGHGDTSALRAAGAFVSAGTPDDEGRLEAALAEVHTLVHVGGGLTSSPHDIVEHARIVARAATAAGVRRVVALSLPGADPTAGEPLRRAKGLVEAVFAEVPCPTVVVRSSVIDTPALRDALVTSGLDADDRGVEVAPVRASDLVDLVVAFDRARSRRTEGHLVVAADGPERCTIAAYLERVGAGGPAPTRVGRRLAPAERTDRLRRALHGPWWTEDEVVVDGWRFAGITPGPPGVG